MTAWVRYWIKRYSDGDDTLVRIRKNPGVALWTELFDEGRWIEDNYVGSYLVDPLKGDEITAEEAAEVMRELGCEWPGEPPPWPILPE